jgi:hypothetical protein
MANLLLMNLQGLSGANIPEKLPVFDFQPQQSYAFQNMMVPQGL